MQHELIMLMWESKYAKKKIINAMLKREIWITTKFTSWRGFSVLSPLNRTSCHVHSLGASSDPKVEALITAPSDITSPLFFVRLAV